ncbi:MAG: hypothetical protein JKY11_00780 [Alphaproteobacteria bacterium]|nr:hypothetical protein [Alphaproteobacteria bacterium]
MASVEFKVNGAEYNSPSFEEARLRLIPIGIRSTATHVRLLKIDSRAKTAIIDI